MIKILTILLFISFGASAQWKYITPEMFGARGNGSTNDTKAVQAAIDSGIKVQGHIILAKNYLVDSVYVGYANGGNYSLRISGNYILGGIVQSKLIATRKEGYVLDVQNGKGVIIEGIYFQGKYTPPPDIYTTDFDDYRDTTCSDDRYGPYVGIAVDWYNRRGTVSGSSGIVIRNCLFTNFTGGIIYSPNGTTLNNELNLIEDCAFQNLKFGFAGCQAQEKDNIIRRVKLWGNIHTAFVWAKYGQRQPGNYFIEHVSCAGAPTAPLGNLVYRPSQGFFSLRIQGGQIESLGSIGFWNAPLGTDYLDGVDINFQEPRYSGYQLNMTGHGVVIRSCVLRIYTPLLRPLFLSGNIKLENTYTNINPVRGTRYLASDSNYQKGFIITNEKMSDVIIENRSTVLVGDYQVGNIIIFYAPTNYNYLGAGEVTQVIKGFATVQYINLKTGRYRFGIYQSLSNT